MKETGVIRRMDELGRIVIPKEIRKRFQIDSGDLVDIFIEDNKIVLTKYHPLSENAVLISNLINSLKNFEANVIVTDKYQVIVSTIEEVKPFDQLSIEFQKRIKELQESECSKSLHLKLTNSYEIPYDFYTTEVWTDGEFYGYVIVLANIISKRQKEMSEIITSFLQMSIK